MKKMLSLLLSGMLILSLLAGCGTAGAPAPSGSSSGSSSAGGGLDIPDSYTLLNTASGSSGGLWYTLMVCYSEVLKNDTGISLQCEPGGGGTANMNAVGVDDHTFGFSRRPHAPQHFRAGGQDRLPGALRRRRGEYDPSGI